MKRRVFVTGFAGLLAAPLVAEAQQAGKAPRIGFLAGGSSVSANSPRNSSWSSTVRPEKADVFSGRQSRQGKSQSPVTRMAAWKETETLKPIDKAIARMVSESQGRNGSERSGGPEKLKLRRLSLTVERRRRYGSSHLADAAARSDGVRATAR